MLKLEKAAKTRELNVILRDKPSFFSRTFLEAMSYALLFHLVALVIFTVSPFKISYEASILPPVHVAIDFLSQYGHQHISAHFDELSQVPSYLIAPRLAPLELPAMVVNTALNGEKTIKSLLATKAENLFSVLEARIESPPLDDRLTAPNSRPLLVVNISGGIAEGSLIEENELQMELKQFARQHPTLISPTPYHFAFSVQVDQRTGRIFWWELISDAWDNQSKDLALDILKKLRFSLDTKHLIESGNVEISMLLIRD